MLRLFLPRRCIRCSEPSTKTAEPLSRYLCSNCLREYNFLEPPDVDELEDRRGVLSELPYPVGIYAGHSLVPEGVLQAIIHHFKYHDMPRLAKTIGAEIAGLYKELSLFTDVILPTPLHLTRYAERGYNQSEILAKQLAKAFHKPLDSTSLRRVKPTPSQTGLSFSQREENVRDAFRLTRSGIRALAGKRVLIVDDVITTGATMASIGKELTAAKPQHVGFFALAAAQIGA